MRSQSYAELVPSSKRLTLHARPSTRSGNLSSTSPASFSRETSFLQQALSRGDASLHGTATPTDSTDDASSLGTRGRSKRRSGGGGSGRLSFSAEGGGRLSPPQESVAEEAEAESETAVSEEELEEEEEGGGAEDVETARLLHEPARRRLSRAPASYHPASENTPLLGHSATRDGITTAAEEEAIWRARKLDDDRRNAFLSEGKILFKYTLPILFTHFLEYSLMATVVVTTGHLGETELAAASLSVRSQGPRGEASASGRHTA